MFAGMMRKARSEEGLLYPRVQPGVYRKTLVTCKATLVIVGGSWFPMFRKTTSGIGGQLPAKHSNSMQCLMGGIVTLAHRYDMDMN